MLVGTLTYLCNSLTVYDLIKVRQMFNYQLYTKNYWLRLVKKKKKKLIIKTNYEKKCNATPVSLKLHVRSMIITLYHFLSISIKLVISNLLNNQILMYAL